MFFKDENVLTREYSGNSYHIICGALYIWLENHSQELAGFFSEMTDILVFCFKKACLRSIQEFKSNVAVKLVLTILFQRRHSRRRVLKTRIKVAMLFWTKPGVFLAWVQSVCSLFRSKFPISVKNAKDQQWDWETAGGTGKIFLHLVNSVVSISIGAKVESNRWTCSMLLKRVLLFDCKRQAHQKVKIWACSSLKFFLTLTCFSGMASFEASFWIKKSARIALISRVGEVMPTWIIGV